MHTIAIMHSQFHGAKFLGIQHASMKCSNYSQFLDVHIKETQKYAISQCEMESQEEPLSDTDTFTNLELEAFDNLRCPQPSTSTAPPSTTPSLLQT